MERETGIEPATVQLGKLTFRLQSIVLPFLPIQQNIALSNAK
jgi:hypothetical protein